MKFFAVFAAILAVTIGAPASMTVNEVSAALQNPDTNPALVPFLEHALNEMMAAIYAGYPADAIQVAMPVVSSWTLHQISEALQNPATNPALVPYLEQALNELMEALVSGQQLEAVAVVVPAGLEPVVPVPSPIPAPVLAPELSPNPSPASASPLVQIIVKISQQGQAPSPVIVSPEPVGTPVSVVEHAEDNSFNPVDVIFPGGVAVNPIAPGPVVGPVV